MTYLIYVCFIYWIPYTCLKTKLTFYSNFPVYNFNINFLNLKTKKKKLKNFFYFLCLYNLLSNKLNNYHVGKPLLLVLKKKKKTFSLLRAPFRHKLSKKNYSLILYKSICLFYFFIKNKIIINEVKKLNNLLRLFVINLFWFETNVQSLYKIDLFFNFFLKKSKL